jgi:hypothetical protein
VDLMPAKKRRQARLPFRWDAADDPKASAEQGLQGCSIDRELKEALIESCESPIAGVVVFGSDELAPCVLSEYVHSLTYTSDLI